MANKYWTDAEIKLLRELIESKKYTFPKMVPFFEGRKAGAIKTKAGKMRFFNKDSLKQKYSYNGEYFAEHTLENCYYAGVFMADASVYQNGRFQWGVADKDTCLIEGFAKAIEFTGKIYEGFNTSPHYPDRISIHKILNIHKCKFTKDLSEKFGVTYGKTFRNVVQNFPTLEHELAFLIGMIDGDGCVYISRDSLSIDITSSSLPTVEWYRRLANRLNLPSLHNGRERGFYKAPDESCYHYVVTGVRAAFLFDMLKKINVPKLSRKWDNPRAIEAAERGLKKWAEKQERNKNKTPQIPCIASAS